jgi:hypothetical protein
MKVSESDNNPTTIILAGAGASVQLGYPTLDDLMQQAIIGNDDIADLIRDVRNTINVKRYYTAVFEEMIVKIKDYIRTAEMLRSDYVLRKEIGQISNDISTGRVEAKFKEALIRCFQILVDSYGPDKIIRSSKEFIFTVQLLETLAQQIGKLHIYTTNYDCAYQVIGSNCSKLAFMSHIDNKDGNFQEMKWYHINKNLETCDIPKVFIHRLHGCIAWFNNVDTEGGAGFINERFGAGGGLEVPTDQLSSMCIKLLASQLLGTNRAFASSFDEFSQHLKTINNLIIWGYSFRDLEVTRQINQALLTRSKPFNIFYIDPFLTEYAAKNNFIHTLRNAPIPIFSDFNPTQIRWTPNDGYQDLLKYISEIVSKGDK